MSRMLASVQRVVSLTPIEGADRIEVARILGWDCVVKKGEFKVGDLGVYFEIDSILPEIPVFEFMRERKFRVKTIKLKKQISQGLFMPFASLEMQYGTLKEGDDLTATLNVKKWEPEEDVIYQDPKKRSLWWKLVYTLPFLSMFRKKVGEGTSFPTHLVPKTDEPRIQTYGSEFLEEHKDLEVSITTKMDGSSCTFIWNKKKFSVASRNVWFPNKKDNNFWKLAEATNIAQAMKKVFGNRNIVLQGEMCGPGIQGNKYKFNALHFFLFGAFDSDKREYLTPEQLYEVYCKLSTSGATIDMVQTIASHIPIKTIGTTVEDWIHLSGSKSPYNPDSWNEGIVVRSMDNKPYGVRGMEGGRFSFKVINPEFLLQYGL